MDVVTSQEASGPSGPDRVSPKLGVSEGVSGECLEAFRTGLWGSPQGVPRLLWATQTS